MDLIPKDKMSRMGLVIGGSLLAVIVLKGLEKNLSKNISNILIVLIVLSSVYLCVEINNSQENFFGDDEHDHDDHDEELSSVESDEEEIEHFQSNNNVEEPPLLPPVPFEEPPPPPPPPAPVEEPDEEPVEQAPKRNNNNNNNKGGVQPSSVNNEEFASVEGVIDQKVPSNCYPQDIVKPEELLPHDKESDWAKNNPITKGSLGDKNFLNAGFHVGVNTVGQSMRNANRQIRSEPANPQVKVSPWMQSTIEPDLNRLPLEIGGNA